MKALGHLMAIRYYSRRFGWPAGLDITRALDCSRPNKIIAIRFLRSAGPLWLRSGTPDITLFKEIFLHEQYREDWNVSPRFILDCGAHIGLASVYFARKYPGARIVSVEPSKTNFDLLLRNTQPYPQITVHNAAVWHTNQFVSIENPSDDSWAFRCNAKDASNIPALTIPELAGGRTIDILKMDIEGAEKMIFSAGNTGWLRSVNILMIEFHDRFHPGCAEAVYRSLPAGFNQQIVAGETVSIKLR